VSSSKSNAPGTEFSRPEHVPRRLAGFAGASSAQDFTIHIIDDAGEVFEITASRENLEAMVDNLQHLLKTGSIEDAHSRG
jgi:hypothetical protein